MYEAIVGPFAEFGFMRRALIGCIAISVGATPVGVFLMLRRMSLTGDAMAHAILPGAAVGFMVSGLSLGAMTIGGLAAGMLVAVLTGLVSRVTSLGEDASLAAFYLISLALGVMLISIHGSNVDLMHVLFGTVLALGKRRTGPTVLYRNHNFAHVSRAASAFGTGMRRPNFPSFGKSAKRSDTFRIFDACCNQSRRRFSGPRHTYGGGHHDLARRRRALLVKRYRRACSLRLGCGIRFKCHWFIGVLLPRFTVRPSNHPGCR